MKHKYLFTLLILTVVSFNSCDYQKDFDVLVEKATGEGSDGGSGPCPQGTWYSPACGDSKGVVWKFGANKKGSMSNKDCKGVCTPMVFTFTYSVQGSTINLVYDAQQPIVKCTGYVDSRPPTPKNASISFVCGDNTLTVTSGNGSNTFTR